MTGLATARGMSGNVKNAVEGVEVPSTSLRAGSSTSWLLRECEAATTLRMTEGGDSPTAAVLILRRQRPQISDYGLGVRFRHAKRHHREA